MKTENQDSVRTLIDSFSRTTDEIFSLEELRSLLLSGKKLIMKYGADATAPDLHIGHAVNLWMYRTLQELGHKVVFLIGDFTTQIGDPTGKSKTRPVIPVEEIERNSKEFIEQAKMVLLQDPDVFEIRRNSEWYDKMSAQELLSLMSIITNDKLLSREMFRRRQKEGRDIYEHELVYPILQGYDSVVLKADLTIIGSDQLFNEMIGRDLQVRFGQQPQVVLTTKITPGIDGGEKQSKSMGNYIGLAHTPREKYGRVMSMADSLVADYLKVYTDIPLPDIDQLLKEMANEPMKLKARLAWEIVKRYHGAVAADEEASWFKKTFSERTMPEDSPIISFGKQSGTIVEILHKCFATEAKSRNELRRLVEQGAVSVDGRVIRDVNSTIDLSQDQLSLKVGKRRWFRLTA